MAIKRLFAIAVLLSVCGYCAGQGISNAPPKALLAIDPLVERQEYSLALARLKEATVGDEEKRAWLLRHADEGHVPLQYELAVLLYPISPGEGLKWYARGRLARTLDAAECATDSASLGARVRLDQRAAVVRDAGVADPKAFQRAINDALAWNDQRANSPSAKWICGQTDPRGAADRFKPEAERLEARAKALRNMRLAAQMISDFERAVSEGEEAGFRIFDSQVVVVASSSDFGWLGWLDNHRLLFIGFADQKMSDKFDPNRTRRAVYLWDVDQNRTEVIAQGGRIEDLCVDGNKVVFKLNENDDPSKSAAWLYSGDWPVLSKRQVAAGLAAISMLQFDCEPPRALPADRSSRRGWLRGSDGFITEAPSTSGIPQAILVRRDNKQIPLPVTVHGSRILAYAPWKEAYLLQGETRKPGETTFRTPGLRQRGDEAVLFWLFPDGRTEAVVVPHGVWDDRNNASAFYRPTRRGLVLAGGDWHTDDAAGYSGLYLFKPDGKVVRLLAGRASTGGISPDGCRIAVAHVLTTLEERAYKTTVRVIDVCVGRR